eukprot:CAMPEP_0176131344 /NCGR_PEP_ID=MMETSP0120_2-20121206/66492_1 /TAXON_ID=160619 /ORGANISM="Kryptoperidinium foliaceum, Strain CCMP 1326" /LENGTH=423 /DNA_ID=CAMNT_0017466717 /DNA_START=123 /DNA_END=1394 /DNA_ORIENTATION=+
MPSSSLRQRKTSKKVPSEAANLSSPVTTKTTHASPSDTSPQPPQQDDDKSWRTVLWKHPLTWVLLLVGLPYLGWTMYRILVLQYPLLANQRPPVNISDPRQVLILGSMSSGTSGTATLLNKYLEIGHEDADTTWKFVRDGTVSWFHGIRYWKQTSIQSLCHVQYGIYRQNALGDNYGFGPTLFGPPQYPCPWWQQSPSIPQSCYIQACQTALKGELSCGLDGNKCETPFQTTLLQTREPWKIVASLVAKYCWNDHERKIDYPQLPKMLHWLLVALQITPAPTTTSNLPPNGVDLMVQYVDTYYSHMLQANLPKYKVEDLPKDERQAACYLMQRAGLDQIETTVYPPNHNLFQRLCQDESKDDKGGSKSVVTTTTTTTNVINKGRVSLEMLLQHASEDSIQRMKRLYEQLDYEYPQEATTHQPP